MLGEAPQAGGGIGWEPGRPLKLLAIMVLLVFTFIGASNFPKGTPYSLRGATLTTAGWLFAIVGSLLMVNTSVGALGVVPGLVFAVWAYRHDRLPEPPPHAPPLQPGESPLLPPELVSHELRTARLWGKSFVIAAILLATLGLWAAWPRDASKTTAAPEVTLFCALACAGAGIGLLRRDKEIDKNA